MQARGGCARAREKERDTTINVMIAVKSYRTFGRAFPFLSDTENLTALDVALYSWEGGIKFFF